MLSGLEQRLQKVLEGYPSILIAFSGGADSSLLLAAACRYMPPKPVLAAICVGPLTPPWEIEHALKLAAGLNAELLQTDAKELDLPEIIANGPLRCYYCKLHKMRLLRNMAAERGLAIVADGSQLDDAKEERPGKRALEELGIISPLAIAGFDKSMVRALSAAWGLPQTPGSACLATRIATNTPLSREALLRIARAEGGIRPLLPGTLRLRDFFPSARLEVEKSQLANAQAMETQFLRKLSSLGYNSLNIAPYNAPGA